MYFLILFNNNEGRAVLYKNSDACSQGTAEIIEPSFEKDIETFLFYSAKPISIYSAIKAFTDEISEDPCIRAEKVFKILLYSYNNLLFIKPQGYDKETSFKLAMMIGELLQVFDFQETSMVILYQVVKLTSIYKPGILGPSSGPRTLLPILRDYLRAITDKEVLLSYFKLKKSKFMFF